MKKTYSSKEVISMLKKQQWKTLRKRGKGSHTVMRSPDGIIVTIPHSKELPIGTQKSIEDQTGVELT